MPPFAFEKAVCVGGKHRPPCVQCPLAARRRPGVAMPLTIRPAFALAAAASLVAALCASCGSPVDGPGASHVDASADQTGYMDLGGNDLGAGEVGLGDLGHGDTAVVDATDTTASADAGDAADTSSDSEAPKSWNCDGIGEPGCPCKTSADCNSGHCIETPNFGTICTAECQVTCPDGYVCVPESGIDVVYLCRPKWPVLCNPCDSDADCASVGVAKSLCVDRGPLGHFCGAGCTADNDCPATYTCQEVTSSGGKSGSQCLPAPGASGPTECTCSFAAKAGKLGTSCSAQSPSGGKSQCSGVRQCGEGGLSACSALASPEVCNGKDDDCDGEIDDLACDDANPCTTDLCNVAQLACSHTATVGTCNADNNACTEGDACQNGLCVPGPPKKCDDGNPCTFDSCSMSNGCTAVNDDGAACDDGSPCSVGDVCLAGQCQPGKPKVCPAAAACQVMACNEETGKCAGSPQPDATGCSDGNACTQADACSAGACVGQPLDCTDNNPCTLDTCDSGSGCKHTFSKVPCDDGNACTDNDTCTSGQCIGKVKSFCNDGNLCTDDACEPSTGCVATNNTAACDDGNACTSGDTCSKGACAPGTSICQCQVDSDCKDDADICNGKPYCDKSVPGNFQCKTNPATVVNCDTSKDTFCSYAACVPSTGLCVTKSFPDGKTCNADSSICTVGDSCQGGVCTPGPALPCDDGSPCTSDACENGVGCTHQNNSAPCDADANGCTGPDVCKAGVCTAGPPLNCADDLTCTADSCDKATASCSHIGATNDGISCDADGSVCTIGDKCQGGICKPGAPADCDDSNACTADTCSATQGCLHTDVADKTSCGTNMVCLSGACTKQTYCGDGIVQAGEQCDDGNTVAGDGCTGCVLDPVGQAKIGDIMITEVMANPGTTHSIPGTTTAWENEWIEVYNMSNHTVDLNGLFFGDSNGKYALEFNKPGGFYIKAGEYALISSAEIDKLEGGPVPDLLYDMNYLTIQFANSGDWACISFDVNCTSNKRLAFINFNSQAKGASFQLSASKYTLAQSFSSANWCFSEVPYGTKNNLGTPKAKNTVCP